MTVIQPQIFVDVLARGDATDVPFAIGNAIKDIGYYRQMAGPGSRAIADGVSSATGQMAAVGHGDAYLPELTRLFRS